MKRIIVALTILTLAAGVADAQGRRRRRDRAPKVGSKAPDFKLKTLAKKKGEKKREDVQLFKVIEKEKKPVVLVFGSYT